MPPPVDTHQHAVETPSAWVVRWSCLIPRPGRVLDLACGAGRHARFLAQAGWTVVAVDRDILPVEPLCQVPAISVRQLDLETGAWPLAGECFDGIVVTNYLHRPLFPMLLAALNPGGALIYETFAQGNERFGKPTNPKFLLQPGELLAAVRGRLHVIAYEDVTVTDPRPACIQRIAAVRNH